MWQHIEPADIERAKESLGHRLSQMLNRHADEMKALQDKQTEEISVLETKQGEIASLEALIECFAAEFQSESSSSEKAIHQPDAGAELENHGAIEDSTSIEAGVASTEALPNGAGPLNITIASPNFRPFRKLAS